MCTVFFKIRKNVQTDSEVPTKLRIVQTLLCFICFYQAYTGAAVAQWLKYCATNREVAGSIPVGVTGIFQ